MLTLKKNSYIIHPHATDVQPEDSLIFFEIIEYFIQKHIDYFVHSTYNVSILTL